VREDYLLRKLDTYNELSKNRNNETDNYYLQHLRFHKNNLKDDKYLVSSYTQEQLLDKMNSKVNDTTKNNTLPYYLSSQYALNEESRVISSDIKGGNFLCYDNISHNINNNDLMNSYYSVGVMTKNRIIDDNNKNNDKMNKKIVGSENYFMMDNIINLYFEKDNQKYFVSWLDDFRDPNNLKNVSDPSHDVIMIPIGLKPESYNKKNQKVNPTPSYENDYRIANKIDFDVTILNL
jgi:hypothetical protein